MTKLIVASRNIKKIKELEAITKSFGYEPISRDDAGLPRTEIPEDGETFEENSFLKADAIMKMSNMPAIADDSGLVVDFLQGAPGVYSARFAGPECDDKKNNRKLLDLMAGVPEDQRTARFVSVITLVFPDGRKLVARGEAEGMILDHLKGDCGFGYDPLFVPQGLTMSFGEISQELKNQISHRARALQKLREMLMEMGDVSG